MIQYSSLEFFFLHLLGKNERSYLPKSLTLQLRWLNRIKQLPWPSIGDATWPTDSWQLVLHLQSKLCHNLRLLQDPALQPLQIITHRYIYIYIYVCMYVCMHVCIYIYIYYVYSCIHFRLILRLYIKVLTVYPIDRQQCERCEKQ